MFTCEICNKTFTHKGHYNMHLASDAHDRKRKLAKTPGTAVKRTKPESKPDNANFDLKLIHRGLKDVLKIHQVTFKESQADINVASAMIRDHIVNLLDTEVAENDGVKSHLRCTVSFYKAVDPEKTSTMFFVSRPDIYLHSTNTQCQFNEAMVNLCEQADNFIKNGSGWVIDRIEKLDIYINRYKPIRGRTYCKLPKKLASKKAIINIKNRDEKCFMWSILAALHPASRDKERVTKYKQYETELDFTGIQQPISLSDIPTFEQKNPKIGINVLGYGDNGLYPLHKTETRDCDIINLLLLTPDNAPPHYCLITDINKLMFSSTKYEHRKFVCIYCLCAFNTQKRLDKHLEFCTVDKQRVEMPKDPKLRFKNVHRQLRAPYSLYADFECFCQECQDDKKLHVPNSYGLLGVKRCCGKEPEYEKPVTYRGDNPVRHFLDTLIQKGEEFIKSTFTPMNITPEQQVEHGNSTHCYLCQEAFVDEDKHRDHCHVCGEYRGAAHAKCNLTASVNRDVTVFFHNLKKYDGHHIINQIGDLLQERGLKLECTAKSMENYISFSVRLKSDGVAWRIKFVDSLAFLPASLETLVDNLPKEKLFALRKFTKHPELLCRKGFYPYDKVTGPKVFDYPGLLPRSDFYNTLTNEDISIENYAHASHVYSTHEFANFGQYHDLYLLTDVLLLSDVFENFRDFMLEHYGLDPAHYITLPSLAWDALLKKTGVQLQLLQDPDMYQFFTAGIRGGISVITHRYARANNPYLSDYDPQVPHSFITYLDANNLYGWAMTQKLPVGDFAWVGEMDAVPHDGYGYVLEVDLEYPSELHDRHNDYPLAAEKIPVPQVSPYCQQLKKDLDLPDLQCEKLIPNLMDKERYIIHHRNLKQCLDLGLKLKKIHRGIRFREEAWMTPYIQFNTEMRTKATNDFDKDLFKLLNNAVFGKSMENVFNYIQVKLTTDWQQYEKLVANPLYRDTRHFKNDLHAVLMAREAAELSKPIYTGFSILELSKLLMYSFHYDYIVPKYGEKAKLLFTDTDSLCYHVMTKDVYQDMLKDSDLFDTSDYPTSHPLHCTKNKKVIGKMKDETNGEPIAEFVGLRAKLYSLKTESEEKKRAKGIARAVVKKEISHENYKDVLFARTQTRHTMTQFRSIEHQIFTVNTTKTSLSAYDDKRFILERGICTLAYGHRDAA